MSNKNTLRKQEDNLINKLRDVYNNETVVHIFKRRKEAFDFVRFDRLQKNYEQVFRYHLQYLRNKNDKKMLRGFFKGTRGWQGSYLHNHDEISKLIKDDLSLSDDVRNVPGLFYECIHFSFELLDIAEKMEEIKENYDAEEEIDWEYEFFH